MHSQYRGENHHHTQKLLTFKLRILITLLIVISSSALAFVLLTHFNAHATTINTYPTMLKPWGITFDTGGHVWIAEPGCDIKIICTTVSTGAISEYSTATGQKIQDFLEPDATFSSPAFLAFDKQGNLWFTEPTSNAIGEFRPDTKSWQQWKTTPGATPYKLVFDNNDQLWFTEPTANKIGMLNTTTHTITENAVPTANARPYGITLAPDGSIWFTEYTQPQLGSFKPTSTGVLTASSITEHTIGSIPRFLTNDKAGTIWYSGGSKGEIGEFIPSTGGHTTFAVTNCTKDCPLSNIVGIAIDSNGKVWFDDPLQNSLGVFDPQTRGIGLTKIERSGAHPQEGFGLDAQNNLWFTEEANNNLSELPVNQLTTDSQTQPGPANTSWYFAEGRVGQGFREYLTIDNPASTSCTIELQYLYTLDGSGLARSKNLTLTVAGNSRVTEPVNRDLALPAENAAGASLASIITVTNPASCPGVVVERPLYASNFHGISSGNTMLGLTHLSKSYAFADIPTGRNTLSYLTILNPNPASINVTADYYADGKVIQFQTMTIAANTRGTFDPNKLSMPEHVAALVSATENIMVERPSYFSQVNGVSGTADVIGTPDLDYNWFFAEGYTGPTCQENLSIANIDPGMQKAAVTITLKSKTGRTATFATTIGPYSQLNWNVNDNNTFPEASPEVSAAVASTGAKIIVQRQMFYHYHHTAGNQTLQADGVTDVAGQAGPVNKTKYSFAEGYTNTNYHEWLTLQNPTDHTEIIYMILANGYGHSYTQALPVMGNSRFTVDVTAIVQQNLVKVGERFPAYEVSMTVEAARSADIFVAERPMYWNTSTTSFATQGSSDIIGYSGS